MRVAHRLKHNRSDWADVPPKRQNLWQRISAKTHGYGTPGNIVSLAGLVLCLVGTLKIYEGSLLLGAILLGIGRLADILDGFVASQTRTKSRVGEALDAGSDKVVIAAGLFVLIAKGVVPLVPLIAILILNVLSASLSLIAKLRRRELHSSLSGKHATIIQWLVIVIFICAKLITSHSVFIADACNVIGYIGLIVFVITAIDAIIGYTQHALGHILQKQYVDRDGSLQHRVHRWSQSYWHKKWLVGLSVVTVFILLFSVVSLAASPYSSDSYVRAPFTTKYVNGQVVLIQHFTPHFYHSWFMSSVGYCEQLVTDVWDRLRSPEEPAGSLQSIVANIYEQRFDPSKPYLISGDQFDGLYLRNLSVFYQDLLNPHTALNTTDWHNRQRIAVQSLAYGLSAMQQLKYPVTTLLPITPRGVIAVNFWSYPSDTMFSLFEQLQTLESFPGTRHVALQLQHQYANGLEAAYQNYLHTVRNPKTGLIRSNIHLSSARDAVQRESSFYDNVILWRTEQLASQLGFAQTNSTALTALRQTILKRYWNNTAGHFIDDTAPGDGNSYSSDWLFALTVGFLNPANPADLSKLERISAFIDTTNLTSPLPIRYTSDPSTAHQDFFVKNFVGNYGNTAVWSYWGDLYITLEIDLYRQTGRKLYAQHTASAIAAWQQVIVHDRGYPETLDAHGNILKTPFYESIRRTGWVVDFETDAYNWKQLMKDNGS